VRALVVSDIAFFRSDRPDLEERITGVRKGGLYRVVDIKRPFFARFMVLAELDGSPILTASGEALEVHECHLQKEAFLTHVFPAVGKKKRRGLDAQRG
jgi:hypothetical protein